MNDHNLDDLIIDNIEPKNKKTKSFLTIVALLIVILIVAIILTKTLLKKPHNENLSFEENISEMIAPELKLQTIPEKEDENNLALSSAVEEKDRSLSIEKESAPAAEETSTIEETPSPEQKKEIEVKKVEPKKVQSTKPESKPEPEPKKVEKPTVTKPVTPVTQKPVQKPKVTKTQVPKTIYYVQVGSFAKDPSARLLSVVKNSGFTYTISSPDVNGNKKVLIGPYKSRAEVDKALKVVRDRITKTAFVYKK